jgi:hypothetical protein
MIERGDSNPFRYDQEMISFASQNMGFPLDRVVREHGRAQGPAPTKDCGCFHPRGHRRAACWTTTGRAEVLR